MYYFYIDNMKMIRAAIYSKSYANPSAKGMYRSSTMNISRLIAKQVTKIPMVTNFPTISSALSKDFLTNYLFKYNKEEQKEMLKGGSIFEKVIDGLEL